MQFITCDSYEPGLHPIPPLHHLQQPRLTHFNSFNTAALPTATVTSFQHSTISYLTVITATGSDIIQYSLKPTESHLILLSISLTQPRRAS